MTGANAVIVMIIFWVWRNLFLCFFVFLVFVFFVFDLLVF